VIIVAPRGIKKCGNILKLGNTSNKSGLEEDAPMVLEAWHVQKWYADFCPLLEI
jgi:hypothetical protein